MKIKVEKRLRMDDVRRLCVEQGYYTCGNNEEYNRMLEMSNSNKVTNRLIYRIADNIAMHSDFKMFQKKYDDITYGELLQHIMYQVNKCCVETFELIQEY